MTPDEHVVIEIFGEGRADVGRVAGSQEPNSGVVPILLHRLCGRPDAMRVKRSGIPFLQNVKGRGIPRKVAAARKLARQNRSDAAVFVMDSEGDLDKTRSRLSEGRDAGPADVPMAIGVAHPCIEAWLLADGPAIRRAMDLPSTPDVPEKPEELPAPCHDRKKNPKTELVRALGANRQETSAKEKDAIARGMNDLELVRQRCPLGFAPFADEVEQNIRPLF